MSDTNSYGKELLIRRHRRYGNTIGSAQYCDFQIRKESQSMSLLVHSYHNPPTFWWVDSPVLQSNGLLLDVVVQIDISTDMLLMSNLNLSIIEFVVQWR